MRKFLFCFIFIFSACASKQVTKDVHTNGVQPNKNSVAPITPSPAIIDTPTKTDMKDRLLDPRMIQNLEIGSPATLKRAVDFIAMDKNGLTDTNRLYLVLISEIMKRLYPYEAITWNVPSYTAENKYLAAFSQIDKGKLPQNLDNSTFFSLVIPCFYSFTGNFSESLVKDFEIRLQAAKTMCPKSVLTYFLEGIMYKKIGCISKAKTAFKTAFEMDNSCTQAGLNYAKLLTKSGECETALKITEHLDALKNTLEYKLLLGESYIGLNDYDKASELATGILADNPDNTDAALLRTKILIATHEYLKANALLDAFGVKNKTDKRYLLLRSDLVLKWSKSTSSALELLTRAYENYPTDFDVLLACAEICFETGQSIRGNSVEDFINMVTEKDAENTKASNLIVRNAIGNENWKLAVSTAENLVAASPTVENRQLLARAYLGANQYGKAMKLATQLYTETESENDNVLSLYLEALLKIGNTAEIIQVINTKMPSANNKLKAILYYYQAEISSGETKLSYLRSSLLTDPRNADALFAMYQYYYAAGDYKKAEYYLKQAIALDPLNTKNTKLLENLQNKM